MDYVLSKPGRSIAVAFAWPGRAKKTNTKKAETNGYFLRAAV